MIELKNRLSEDLKSAMKVRNHIAVKTIRNLISAIDNAGAVQIEQPKDMPMAGGIAGAVDGLGAAEVRRNELTETDVEEIVRKEIAEVREAMMVTENHPGSAAQHYAEQILILEKYLL